MTVFKPRFSDFIFISIFIIALALGSQMLGLDSDLGRHLTLGSHILDTRLIPIFDLLSHTRTELSRPPYEWLSQVLFTLAYRLLGLDGVILLTAFIIALTFAIVYQFASRRSKLPILTLLFVFLAAGASSLHWLPRPHIFTFLLLAIWVEYLEQVSQGKSIRLYIFPIIMLFWANLHGGFVFGILAWIAYFAGWLWNLFHMKANAQIGKNLLVVGVSSLIATIITPDLWHNWEAVLNNHSAFILNRTIETMQPNLADTSILPYTLFLLLSILLFVINWKMIKPQHFFLFLGLGFISLLMARNIPLFVIACTPILSEMGASPLSSSNVWIQFERRFAGFSKNGWSIWPSVVILLAIGYLSFFNIKNERSVFQFDSTVFPVETVRFIEANPQSGNMFNEFNWGGYLEYKLWPHYNVFLDSQSDFYGETLMREYDQIMSANGNWNNLLEKYNVEWAIIPPDMPLASTLQSELGWNVLYQDNTAIILRKPYLTILVDHCPIGLIHNFVSIIRTDTFHIIRECPHRCGRPAIFHTQGLG